MPLPISICLFLSQQYCIPLIVFLFVPGSIQHTGIGVPLPVDSTYSYLFLYCWKPPENIWLKGIIFFWYLFVTHLNSFQLKKKLWEMTWYFISHSLSCIIHAAILLYCKPKVHHPPDITHSSSWLQTWFLKHRLQFSKTYLM